MLADRMIIYARCNSKGFQGNCKLMKPEQLSRRRFLIQSVEKKWKYVKWAVVRSFKKYGLFVKREINEIMLC